MYFSLVASVAGKIGRRHIWRLLPWKRHYTISAGKLRAIPSRYISTLPDQSRSALLQHREGGLHLPALLDRGARRVEIRVAPQHPRTRGQGVEELYLVRQSERQLTQTERVLRRRQLPHHRVTPFDVKHFSRLQIAFRARHRVRAESGRGPGRLPPQPHGG